MPIWVIDNLYFAICMIDFLNQHEYRFEMLCDVYEESE